MAPRSVPGRLYAIGGLANGNSLRGVEAYDLAADEWTRVAAMNTPRADFAAVHARSSDNETIRIGWAAALKVMNLS